MIAPCPRLALVLSSVVFGSTALAQQVLVVDPVPGPGVHSTEIQPAIEAAGPADLVLVKSGSYAPITIRGRSARIVAEAGADVKVKRVSVTGIGPSEHAFLQGLTIGPSVYEFGFPATALNIDDSTGPIWLEACNVKGSGAQYTSALGARVSKSACVSMIRCRVRGGGSAWGSGSPGIEAEESNLYIVDGDLEGGNGGGYHSGYPGQAAVKFAGGSLYASGSTFQGGNGGIPAAKGGDGILAGGPVNIIGCSAAGGKGGDPGGYPIPPGEDGARFRLVHGGTVEGIPGKSLHLLVSSPLREGDKTTLTCQGTPGAFAAVLVSLDASPASLHLELDGALFVDPAGVSVLPVGWADVHGIAAIPIAAPELPPSISGFVLWMQSFEAGPAGGGVRLGAPAAVALLEAGS